MNRGLRALLVAGCALMSCTVPTIIPDDDRARAVRQVEGRLGFMRVSCYVAALEVDPAVRLLTPYPLGDVASTYGPDIKLASSKPEKILRVGTRVGVLKLEFPTAAVEVRQAHCRPRRRPWLYLRADGEPPDRSFVVVLPDRLASDDEVISAVEQIVSWESMDPFLESYMQPVRRAVEEKRVIPGMDAAAVLMAWGWPDRREIVLRDTGREETWTYSSGRRRVSFEGDRVSRAEPSVAF